MKSSITLDIFDENGASLGKKRFYTYKGHAYIIEWLRKFYDKNTEHLAFLRMQGTDFSNNRGIFFTTTLSGNDYKKHLFTFITPNNLIPTSIYFSVRHCIKATWINDRDQFLAPNKKWEKDTEFQNDCLIFMLFHGKNRITSEVGINHFIPFSEKELGAAEAFDSNFMFEFIQGKIKQDFTCHTERSEVSKKLDSRFFANAQNEVSLENDQRKKIQYDKVKSKLLQTSLFNDELEKTFIPTKPLEFSDEAKEVLQAAKELFKHYHEQTRDSKDYNANAAIYDIKAHFQGFNDKGKMNSPQKAKDVAYKEKLGNLNYALKDLAKKLESKIYEYEFLLP